MTSELELFRYGNIPVRVVILDGEPWFVLADLCKALGHSNSSVLLRRLDPDGVNQAYPILDSLGRTQHVVIVDEPNMYEVVLRSDKAQAVGFRRWITGEVLPSIRKTGSYGIPTVRPLTGLEYARKLVEVEERAEALAARVEIAEERAEEGDRFKRDVEGGDGLAPTDFHKKYFSALSHGKFFDHLYRRSYLINQLGKGSKRKDGTYRDGPQHGKPGWRGKPYFYLHYGKDRWGRRCENARVRAGYWELALRDQLAKEGLPANETGLFAIEGGQIQGELA